MRPAGQQAPRAATRPRADALRGAAVRTLAVDAQTARVVSALAARGIQSLVLKGPGVARRLYAADGRRFYGDTDLLVAPHALAEAHHVLRDLGYEQPFGPDTLAISGRHGMHWRHRASGLEVDLHHALIGARADPQVLWDVLSEHTSSIDVDGVPVRVPNVAGMALHVALHAAQHGIARETPRRDLRRALEHLDVETWRAAAALAERVDAGDAFGAGLRLLPEGVALAARLGLPPNRSRDAALRVMSAPAVTLGVERLRATPGRRAKARLVLRSTFPPPDFMRTRSALARRGRAGLLLAYAWRPLALAGQTGSAIVAWRRAARATSGGGS